MKATRQRRWLAAVALVLGSGLVLGGSYAGSELSSRLPITTPASAQVSAPSAFAAPEPPLAGAPDDLGREFPWLPGEDSTASVSVGDTSHGFLVGGRELLENDAVAILPKQRDRGLRYGTEPIIEMIQAAGRALFAETKTRLWVGNIGKQHGGDITWSVSHNSGRDADLAFCYMNHKGEPVDPPDLVPLNGEGLAKGQDLRLDPKRTWLVIKGLLAYPKAEVQYLFMAEGLKTQVLMHAAQSGESAELLLRAGTVIRQPVGSAPHNDHLHLRIFCTETDVLGGCVNTGSVHPTTKLYEAERRQFVKNTAARLGSAAADERKRAIQRLALLDAKEAANDIAAMLAAETGETDVREAAARALARLGGPTEVPILTKHFRRERDPLVRIAIIQAVGDIGGREAGRFLARAIGEPQQAPTHVLSAMGAAVELGGPVLVSVLPQALELSETTLVPELFGQPLPPSEREADALMTQLVAIEAAAKSERLEPVPRLIALLSDPRPLVRERAANALHMITNLSYHIPWKDGDAAVLERGRARWKQAFERTRGAPRNAWLALGFQAAGFQVRDINQSQAWELVRAVGSGSDYISFNAQRVLMRLTKHAPPSTEWSKGAACTYWLKWLRGRRDTFKLEKPTPKVMRACGGA